MLRNSMAWFWSGLLASMAVGCSSSDDGLRNSRGLGPVGVGDSGGTAMGATGGTDPTGGDMFATGGMASGGGFLPSGGSAATGGTDGGDDCGSEGSEAELQLVPTDVVWAIDSSGSMVGSFPAIQEALSTFSQRVTDAGIDAHIILLAGADSGLCVPQPLGSGQCGPALVPGGSAPDSREPYLRHLDLPFGQDQGMSVLLNNYPAYKGLLRANAITHLVLTEDGAPPMSSAAVVEHIEGRTAAPGTLQGPWTPGLQPDKWVFHGVVCEDVNRTGACLFSFAFEPPATTLELVAQTNGQLSNLDLAGSATDPFAQLLDRLAEQVIVGASVSCEYAIPTPPSGATLDKSAVNVTLSAGGSDALFLQVPEDIPCGNHVGWTYDDWDTPTRVILCPAACEAAQSQASARVDVQFGCATKVLPLE